MSLGRRRGLYGCMRHISHPGAASARRTGGVSISEFTLPSVDRSSLVRRVALPVALAMAIALAVVVAGGRVPAVAGILRRAVSINAGWVGVGAAFEALSLAGYVALLACVAGRATARVRVRESALI